ncbi:MAG: hypothetical protein HQL42_19385 [Alphaproteobacteria bacterium]|nr:hypothetical protein [Alphaproteobacteria bacterium]
MQLGKLTFLAFYLNSAIDTGRYKVTFNEVAAEIEAGTIFDFLAKRLSGNIDLSIFDTNDRNELVAEWQDMLAAINARRKMGIENNGICLLIGYLLEGIQRRYRD